MKLAPAGLQDLWRGLQSTFRCALNQKYDPQASVFKIEKLTSFIQRLNIFVCFLCAVPCGDSWFRTISVCYSELFLCVHSPVGHMNIGPSGHQSWVIKVGLSQKLGYQTCAQPPFWEIPVTWSQQRDSGKMTTADLLGLWRGLLSVA